MDERGIAARIHDLNTAPRWALISLLLGAMSGLAWWGLNSTTADLPIALWWPAAAFAAGAVLASRGRRVAITVVVAVLATVLNLGIARSLELSVAYGVANAAEAWVVVWLLTRGRPHARLLSLVNAGWLLVSATLGAVVIAVLGGIAAVSFAGADPLAVGPSLFTSHASALYAILPLLLVPLTVPLRAPVWEPIVQSLALIVLTVVVFAPAAALGLTFFIITTLMWGGFRLPPVVAAVQTIALAFVATIATALNFGPFAQLAEDDVRGAIIALQLFVMTHAAAALFVAGQAHDWNSTADALAAREREAQRVAEELRRLSQQKDDFISAVSHELRTPVTSIIGFSENLVDDASGPDVKQAGQVIYRNARRLADVIEDVLELSRLSTQRSSSRAAESVDLSQLLTHSIEDTVAIVPPERNVTVTLVGAEHPILIQAVEQDIVRVCSNLLSNAIKFSPPGGTVTVTVGAHPDGVQIVIDDEGPGIPLAEQDAIWDRFYRVQSTDAHRAVPGTGLGLPIVRSLIEARIGGSVELVSDGTHGTRVTVVIPRQPPATASLAVASTV